MGSFVYQSTNGHLSLWGLACGGQDLENNSLWLFNGHATTIRTDQTGSVTFDVTATGSSPEAFWAYFTKAGSPIVLGVGEKLSVSVPFSITGFQSNGADVGWGVFDSLGTRNTANLIGGQPFIIGRRTVLSSSGRLQAKGNPKGNL